MSQGESASNISRLTELLAAHGVYALTIIFIFYQQWRAGRNLKTASAEDHAYFRRVNTSVITVTYGLVVISSLVWIYATFVYIPRIYIKSSVSGLTERTAIPQQPGDLPKLEQHIALKTRGIELFQSKDPQEKDSPEGKYNLTWVLLPHSDLRQLVFSFQHSYAILGRKPQTPDRAGHSAASPLEIKTLQKTFSLNLDAIHYSPGSEIPLIYEPDLDDSVRNMGKIYFQQPNGAQEAIPWEEDSRESHGAGSAHQSEVSLLFGDTAYASSRSEKPVFGAKGDYDPQIGRILRERLGSSDLKTQLAARDLLVDNRDRSFRFIADSLDASSETGYDRGVMLHNLAAAMKEIDSAGNPAPRNLTLKLAQVFLGLQDYEYSAHLFDQAGNAPLETKDLYFARGVAYSQSQQYAKAIPSFEEYLKRDPAPYGQAVTHTELGVCFDYLKHDKEAIREYRKAMQLYPDYATPYNNLAYLYADRETNLAEALNLVDRALKLEHEPDSVALDKDTKAWILYKLGKREEALVLIKDAAAGAPYDHDVQRHLQIIQKSNSRNAVKN
jgi:tetratricopeptide (TPR) repeat protein